MKEKEITCDSDHNDMAPLGEVKFKRCTFAANGYCEVVD